MPNTSKPKGPGELQHQKDPECHMQPSNGKHHLDGCDLLPHVSVDVVNVGNTVSLPSLCSTGWNSGRFEYVTMMPSSSPGSRR